MATKLQHFTTSLDKNTIKGAKMTGYLLRPLNVLLWFTLRGWIPALILSSAMIASLHGQEPDRDLAKLLSRNVSSPALSRQDVESNASVDKDEWTEYEIKSFYFHLPDHWHVVAAEQLGLENAMSEVVSENPHLKQTSGNVQLKDLDVFAVNTRDSSPERLEILTIKLIDRPLFDRTSVQILATGVTEQLKEQAVAQGAESDIIQVAGSDVGRVRYFLNITDLRGRVVSVETLQYLFLNKRKIVVVTFQHAAHRNSSKIRELEEIVKTFSF